MKMLSKNLRVEHVNIFVYIFVYVYCKDRRKLAGNLSDHPDERSDCMVIPVEKDPRARDELGRVDPRPPLQQGWTSVRAIEPLYKQPGAAKKTLYHRQLSQREVRGAVPSLPARRVPRSIG